MSEDLISRREFLRRIGRITAAALLTSCAPTRHATTAIEKSGFAGSGVLAPLSPSSEMENQFRLEDEQSADIQGLPWVPDTRTSFIKKGDANTFFFSADNRGFTAEGRDLSFLSTPQEFIRPSLKGGEYGINCYRGPATVFDDGRGNFWSVEHFEEWTALDNPNNFTSRVALSQSKDNGVTWIDRGIILDGQAPEKAGVKVSGAGQPCGIVREVDGVQHLYLYYTDWGIGADEIHLARAPLGQIDNPDAWQKYNQGYFSSSGKGPSSPVILRPEGQVYAAQAGISWNKHLNKFLASYETGTGFRITTSIDGIDWSKGQRIANFPQSHDKRQNGSNWYSYPTLLSLDQPNQFTTSKEGIMVYSKGVYGVSPTEMKYRKFSFS